MCGIAGIFSFERNPVEVDRLARMTDAMVHRGPDDEGFFASRGVGLGMRRLSIIDVDHGRQPIGNEDGSVQVILNGEIYNYQELRRELESRGHRFTTRSDTEVIVHLYEELGDDCVERLRGMFAFAVWDGRRGRLLVARDRLGIKPLYFARYHGPDGDTLAFASELKCILALGELPVTVDGPALSHLFSFLTTPANRSIVAGVEKLEPGHLLTATDGGLSVRRYWQVTFEPRRDRSIDEWVEAIREELQESVRLHLISDVELGAFLSGGVDSSAVAAAMSRVGAGSIKAFSIGFEEGGFNELDKARVLARRYGLDHREQTLRPEVMDDLGDLAWYLDEPFGDSSAIPTYMLSRLAGAEVKVALSGDGGDELFAGYERYQVERRERLNRFLPRPVRRLLGSIGHRLPEGATGREMLRHLALVGGDRYLDACTLFRPDQQRRLFQPDVLDDVGAYSPAAERRALLDSGDLHWLSALQRLDLETYLPLDILTKVDRMSMAHSLEARVPLLDHHFVELAATVPPELQLRGGVGKSLFKKALEGWVPDDLLHRPKQGFAVPLGDWFRGRLNGYVRELLTSPQSLQRGFFSPAYVDELLQRHESGRPLDLHLWTMLSFELWCRTFLDADAGRRPATTAAERSRRARRTAAHRQTGGGAAS